MIIEITKEKNPKDNKDEREDNNQKRLGKELPSINHMIIIKSDCYS